MNVYIGQELSIQELFPLRNAEKSKSSNLVTSDEDTRKLSRG